MGENEKKLREAILSVLAAGSGKPTSILVQEIKLEYPGLWETLIKQGEANFDSGCLREQWPSTRVKQLLFELEQKGRVIKETGGEYRWRLG